MEHKIFTVLCLILFGITSIIVSLYEYFISYEYEYQHILVSLKPIPLSCMAILSIIYMIMYKRHVYSMFFYSGFLFSVIGDVILTLEDFHGPYDPFVFLTMGGICFTFGRFMFISGLLVYPFNDGYEIEMKPKKIMSGISIIVLLTLMVGFVVLIITNISSKLESGFTGIYIFLMFFQSTVSCIRLGAYEEETLRSQIFGCIGSIVYMVSDCVLLINMHVIDDNRVAGTFSRILYWYGMYFLTISLVRTDSSENEKRNSTYAPLVPT